MKTLGILGGVGPETTSKVYHSVIDSVRKNGGKYYPSIIIYNLPWPFSLEDEMIIHGRNSEKMIPYLVNGAKILEKAGASFGVLPCNTLHKHINEIRASVKIPFLSILEETKLKLKSLNINKVGILASQTTINSNLYGKILQENDVSLVHPSKEEQDKINKVIVELVRGKSKTLHSKKLTAICKSLSKSGAKSILLACTDLQLIGNIKSSVPIIDTTEVLIQASVRELLRK
ncbi:MAG: amino acid racemase [Candidatus Colwellbacteria bacterium]|nr:amino acid racemase [Candidatus Colwellbacteria bacterium]